MKMKARTVVGRGEESFLSDPGSELRLGGRRDNNAKIKCGMSENFLILASHVFEMRLRYL